jgi:alcohol dehydrogenase class IV
MISDISQIKDFKKVINSKKFSKIFLITGKNSYYKSKADIFLNIPKDKILKFYFKKSYLPEFNELMEILKEAKNFNPDVILAIGGGAVIDYAKIISIVNDMNMINLKKKLINYDKIGNSKVCPLIAIPTTAGAGAEVTSNAVIYINSIKYSVEDRLLIPDYFFLFTNLIINNPKKLKSSAGFDAIAQAVESLISVKSNKASVSFAKKSLILSTKNYLSFVNKPNTENSKKMLIASNLAGKAINISKTTAPHAVSYPFSTLFGISHGHAVSLTFEKFLLFNFKKIENSEASFNLKDRYKIIFDSFDVKNINELYYKIKFLKKEANLEDSFRKLNINIRSNLNQILKQINILRLKNNPIPLNKKDIKYVLTNDFNARG